MKIRIKGNSVRLRLTKTEVDQFCKAGSFAETTNFGNIIFSYKLVADTDAEVFKTTFNSNEIIVTMPSGKLEEWKQESVVGFSEKMTLENGDNLLIKVEKDFVCLDETEEDQSDNYPNPRLV